MKSKIQSPVAIFSPWTRSVLIGCAAISAIGTLHAASGTWTGATSGGTWGDSANWSGGVIADGSGSAANLASTDLPAGVFQLNLNADRTIGAITFGDVNPIDSAGTWQIDGAGLLTLAGGTPNLTTAVDATIAPVIAGTGGLTKSGPASLTLSNANTFTGLLKVNAGNLTLANTNSYADGTTIASGATLTLGLGTNYGTGGLGGGTVDFQGGSLNSTMGNNNTLVYANTLNAGSGQTGVINTPNRFEMTGPVTGSGTLEMHIVSNATRADFRNDFSGFDGKLNFTGTGGMRLRINQKAPAFNGAGLANATVDLGGGVFVTVLTNSGGNTIAIGALTGNSESAYLGGGSAGSPIYAVGALGESTTYAGGLTGNASLSIEGASVLTLTNTSNLTSSGQIVVNDGMLVMNGVKTGTGPTNVNTFGTVAGTGALSGTTTVKADGVLSPGDEENDGGLGTLSFENLTLQTGSYVKIQFGAGADKIKMLPGGTLTLGTGVQVDVDGFGTAGSYAFIDIAGATLSGIPSSAFVAVNGASGKVYTFQNDGNAVSMVIGTSDPSNYWKTDGDGAWGNGANWTKGAAPNAPGAIARFGPGIGGSTYSDFSNSPTVTLDAVRTVGDVTFDDNLSDVVFTIVPGTSGSLLFDNGTSAALLTSVSGPHSISAPVAIDADGLMVAVASDNELFGGFTIDGNVSGSSAWITKIGVGPLRLFGTNTYGGGTLLSVGAVEIDSADSLGSSGAPARFAGGTLRLTASLAGVTRNYQVSGGSDAIVDTNGFDLEYNGVISPFSGGTGGLVKTGAGTMLLGGVNAYNGSTKVSGGVLAVGSGGSITSSFLDFAAGSGSQFLVDGGSFAAAGLSYLNNGNTITLLGGSMTFPGGIDARNNSNARHFIAVSGGTFEAGHVSLGRGTLKYVGEPAAGSTADGFYTNGGVSHISGAFDVGYANNNVNSSASTRIDAGGSLTVDGVVQIGLNSPDRWSVLDVNGGSFTSTDAATGVLVGNGGTGGALFLVRGGTASAERISLDLSATSTAASRLRISGGALYVGAGGIQGNNNAGAGAVDVRLGSGTLAATANWASPVEFVLSDSPVIMAADAASAGHDIELSGMVSGAAGFTKSGVGKLTLSGTNIHTGAVSVAAGTLEISGDSSGATGAVTVQSGATLGGSGNIGGNVTITSGGRQTFAIGANANDQVTRVVYGTLTMNSGTFLDITKSAAPASGIYILAKADGGITGPLPTVAGVNGTVAINGSNLELTVIGGGYSTWAAVNAGGQLANGDYDMDGVPNGVEYFMNSAPGFTANPSISGGAVTWPNGGNLPPSAYGTEYVVQISNDLTHWSDVPAGSLTSNTAGTLTYKPTGAGKSFVRLAVDPN